ncbi:hypothetical protein TYRP_021389 [Tyrophagus putrescentiae]|nr:hypothetical protein TYRP_021389 [Tyrophagus putrescentiae]
MSCQRVTSGRTRAPDALSPGFGVSGVGGARRRRLHCCCLSSGAEVAPLAASAWRKAAAAAAALSVKDYKTPEQTSACPLSASAHSAVYTLFTH